MSYFLQQARERYPVGVLHAKTNSPGAPLGRDTVSRAVGHPATAKPQLTSWECVHPRPSTGNYVTATHQEEFATAALRLGKDAPREAAQFPQPPRPGWCIASELLPPKVQGCCISGQNTLEVDPYGATGEDGSHEPGKTPRHIDLRTI